MSNVERLEAIGSRGEAVIILRRGPAAPPSETATGAEGDYSYELASGERLQPTEDQQDFETRDGRRRFTLR